MSRGPSSLSHSVIMSVGQLTDAKHICVCAGIALNRDHIACYTDQSRCLQSRFKDRGTVAQAEGSRTRASVALILSDEQLA